MKTHRRIEITAYKRRVTIVSGEYEALADENDGILPAEESPLETIAPDSAEGRRLLDEAVRLLQKGSPPWKWEVKTMNRRNTKLMLIIGAVLMSSIISATEAGSQQIGRIPFVGDGKFSDLRRLTRSLNAGKPTPGKPVEVARLANTASTFGPGSLDPAFDGDGKLTTSIALGTGDLAHTIAIQPDGKIVAAGTSYTNGERAAALVRYNTDGSLDASFGMSGKVITPALRAFAIALQPDGKIVAAGDNGPPAAVFRYNSDGTLDMSFGVGGIVSVSFYDNDIAYAIALQADEKIVIAGYGEGPFYLNHTADFCLARLNVDGSLDTSFGMGGKVIAPMGSGGFFADIANSVIIQPTGRLLPLVGRLILTMPIPLWCV